MYVFARELIEDFNDVVYAFCRGVRNLVRWAPIIWNDEDFNSEYLLRIMEWKLKRMSEHFAEHDRLVGSQKEAREMLTCSVAIKRIRSDDFNGDNVYKNYFSDKFYRHNYAARQKGLPDILYKLMSRRMNNWWC